MQKTPFYLFNVGMLIPVLGQVLCVRCLKLFPRQKGTDSTKCHIFLLKKGMMSCIPLLLTNLGKAVKV